jgi:hypothetical protein
LTFQTRLGVIFLVSACPVLLLADGVAISSSCSLTSLDISVSPPVSMVGASQVNPTGNCSVGLAGGRASAGANATLYLPVQGSPSIPVGAEIRGDIRVFPSGQSSNIINIGDAQFSIALVLLFSTPGPVRSGFISLTYEDYFGNGPDAPDVETSHVSLGSFIPNLIHQPLLVTTPPLFNFTLGQEFLFHEDLALEAFGNEHIGVLESALPTEHWTFTLFEADGVTPVQVSLATSEPGSSVLSAGGLLILLSCLLVCGRCRGIVPTP